jgi:ADP-ribose pyrophosphatase YjhB (NUDIX family)
MNKWTGREYGPCWGAPGGRQEPGESLADTAVREVREETGLAVAVDRLAYLIEYEEFVAAYFLTRRTGDEPIVVGDEIAEVRFVPLDELPHFAPGALVARHPILNALAPDTSGVGYHLFPTARDVIS